MDVILKILHVWDQAGVACVLAKYQRRLGHQVDVLKRAGFDNYGIMRFYGDMELNMDGGAFTDFVLYVARNYDLIHVHSLRDFVRLLKGRYPEKKCVIHYHGTELRSNTDDAGADLTFVSTPDLVEYLPDACAYLPNPVDLEHFNSSDYKPTLDTLYHIRTSYERMPSLLKRFHRYVDQKYDNEVFVKAYSLLGLQALACGLTVLNYENSEASGLPDEHKPEIVLRQLEGLLSSNGLL